MAFWKKKDKAGSGEAPKKGDTVTLGHIHFMEGESVQFDLGELPFTFGKFYATFTEQGFVLEIKKEAPMNLAYVAEETETAIDSTPADLMDAEYANIDMKLRDEVFNRYKHQLFGMPDIQAVFHFEDDGEKPLLKLSNYMILRYAVM